MATEREIRLKVSAQDEFSTVFGKAQTAVKDLAKSASGDGGFIDSVKAKFGRRSELGEISELFMGAGPVAGLTKASELAERLAHGIQEFSKDLRDPEKSTAQIALNLGEQIPILGGIIKTGRGIRELLTGEQAAIDAQNRGVGEVDEAMKVQKELAKSIRDYTRETSEAEEGLLQRIRGANSAGEAREDQERAARRRKERQDVENKAQDKRDAFTGQYQPQIAELRKKLGAEEAQATGVYRGPSGQLLKGEGEIPSFVDAKSDEGIAFTNAETLRRKIADVSKKYNEEVAKADADKTKELKLLGLAQAAEEAEALRKRSTADIRYDEQEQFDNQRRHNQLVAKEKEESLRAAGRNVEADLSRIDADAADKRLALERKIQTESQRLAEQHGTTPAQEIPGAKARFAREGAEIEREAADQTANVRRQARQADIAADIDHYNKLRDVQFDAHQKELQAAGQSDQAELDALIKAHQDKMNLLAHQRDEEMQQHGERGPTIQKNYQELAAAESNLFAAQLVDLKAKIGDAIKDMITNSEVIKANTVASAYPGGPPSAAAAGGAMNAAQIGKLIDLHQKSTEQLKDMNNTLLKMVDLLRDDGPHERIFK